jgi:hypothetical protein
VQEAEVEVFGAGSLRLYLAASLVASGRVVVEVLAGRQGVPEARLVERRSLLVDS